MSDIFIYARDLKNVCRPYAEPGYRFRDIIGLLGKRTSTFSFRKKRCPFERQATVANICYTCAEPCP